MHHFILFPFSPYSSLPFPSPFSLLLLPLFSSLLLPTFPHTLPLSHLSSRLLCPCFSLSRQLNLLNTHKMSQLTWGTQHCYATDVTHLGSSYGSTIYWMAQCGSSPEIIHVGKSCSGYVSWVCLSCVSKTSILIVICRYFDINETNGDLMITMHGGAVPCWRVWMQD